MKPVALPNGVLEEFLKNSNAVFTITYEKPKKNPQGLPSFFSYFIFIFMYIDVSDGNSSLVFFKLFPVKNLRITKEFFNHSELEFLEIPTEFRLEKQLAYLHSFVASLHPIWFGHEGDVLIISHQLVPLMLKYFIYSSTR